MNAPALKGGFVPPAPGVPMCQAMTKYDHMGKIAEPRPCRRAALGGGIYCGGHQAKAERLEQLAGVRVQLSGFCVVCSADAFTYELDGTRIALCGRHGKSLAWAIGAQK